MNQREIPIENIYYLFCYAWGHAEELDLIRANDLEQLELVQDLLGKLLANGVFHLVRTGLDRGYLDQHDELRGVRGKINVSRTVKRALRAQGQVACDFQELSHDVIHNQIVRTTLHNLLRIQSLDKQIRSDVLKAYHLLSGIQMLRLSRQTFSQVQLDRNRRYYRLILTLCRLIFEQLLIEENTGEQVFRELSEEKMYAVFELFVFEFFRREQNRFSVSHSQKIRWESRGTEDSQLHLLPNMYADVVLESKAKTIILDTKYYKEALADWHGKKLHSPHLYQLTAYLRNRQMNRPDGAPHEGMLLYPTVKEPVTVNLVLEGFSIKVRSVDLAQHWQEIHESMLNLIA